MNLLIRPQRIIDIFVAPADAANEITFTHAWFLPWVLATVGAMCVGFASESFYMEAIYRSVPQGTSSDQVISIIDNFRKSFLIGILATGIILPVKWLMSTIMLSVTCVLFNLRPDMRRIFALMAHCNLILLFQDFVSYMTLIMQKRYVDNDHAAVPDFSLNLLFDFSNPLTRAISSYFSVFNLWYAVILTLALAPMLSISRKRSFLVCLPVLIFPLIVVVGFNAVKGQ